MTRNLGLTCAGGGNRAFYQYGWLERWWPRLEPRIGAVSACSAGASVVLTYLSGRRDLTHAYWMERRRGITRNFDWSKLLRGRRPTPHHAIYRDTMRLMLADGGFERIRALPFPVLVLTAAPPPLPLPMAAVLGMAGYSIQRSLYPGRLHPTAGRRLGFRPVATDARQCGSPDEVVDLILASSSTPPFLPAGRINGNRVLDGGLVDNAPAFLAEQVPGIERTVVLLTRPYPDGSVGARGNRYYLAPGAPVPISRWDYTSDERVEQTLRLGEREAEERGAEILRWAEG